MIENHSRSYGKFVCGAFVDFEDGEYYLICDNCGKRIRFEDFDEAVAYKKKNKWKSRKQGEEWLDICNECLE